LLTRKDIQLRILELFSKRDSRISNRTLVFLFIVAGIFHFLITLITESPTVFVTSVSTAKQILDGKILYYDVRTPYPAGYPAWPPIWPYFLALVFSLTSPSELVVRLLCVIFTMLCGVIIYRIGTIFFSERGAYLTTLLFFINPYTILISLGVHFEGLAVLFLLLAVLFAYKNRATCSGLATALGIMTKIFPGVFIAIVIPYWLGKRQWREAFLYLFSCAITCTFIALPFLFICPDEFFYWIFGFHSGRNSGGISIIYYWFYYTELWTGSLSFIMEILFLICISLLIYQKSRKKEMDFQSLLINWSFISFLGFMIFIRVLYSRYLAFTIPFLCFSTIDGFFNEPDDNPMKIGILQQVAFLISFLGVCISSIPWIIEDFSPQSFRPSLSGIEPFQLLYWIGAIVFHVGFIGSFILSLFLIWIVYYKAK
jgi:4-amino-4-deoxy-L-arabinose transferase-like glycosyltransferase